MFTDFYNLQEVVTESVFRYLQIFFLLCFLNLYFLLKLKIISIALY